MFRTPLGIDRDMLPGKLHEPFLLKQVGRGGGLTIFFFLEEKEEELLFRKKFIWTGFWGGFEGKEF